MRTLLLTLAAAAALAVAGTASAGGWATAGVNPPPDDPTAGSTWDAKITILQHGNADTPLSGISPTLSLIGKGGEKKTFAAKETNEPGVYVAKVKFPAGGDPARPCGRDRARLRDAAHAAPAGTAGLGAPRAGRAIAAPPVSTD